MFQNYQNMSLKNIYIYLKIRCLNPKMSKYAVIKSLITNVVKCIPYSVNRGKKGGKCQCTKLLVLLFSTLNCAQCEGARNTHVAGSTTDLQWTVIGPSWPNCSLVLCTCPMKSMNPSADLGTPCSGQSVNWNCLTVREPLSIVSVTLNSLSMYWGMLYSVMGSTTNVSYRIDRSEGQYW